MVLVIVMVISCAYDCNGCDSICLMLVIFQCEPWHSMLRDSENAHTEPGGCRSRFTTSSLSEFLGGEGR